MGRRRRKVGGRPPRAGVVADRRVEIRVTEAELERWQQLAGELTLSEWIRERCNS